MDNETTHRPSSRKHIISLAIFVTGALIVAAAWPPERNDTLRELAGSSIIVAACFLMLYLFLAHFRKEILDVSRKTLFIVMVIVAFLLLTRLVAAYQSAYVLLIPFTIIPVIICIFYDARLALFTLMIVLLLAGFMVHDAFEFIFINFISGVAAIFMLTNIYRQGKIFYAAAAAFASYSVLHLAHSLLNGGIAEGSFWLDYEYLAANGLLTLLSYPVIFMFEKNFYFLSDATLLELSDLNHPLLRHFAEEAPGSFQHSLQVANLAGEACRRVGANALLARTGALYHDIGKIPDAAFFAENMSSGVNPHDNLSPAASAAIITGHVEKGVALARQYKLPVQITDFIRTHHGTTRAYYFYMKYLKDHSPGQADESCFSYAGPRPFTKETAIVMMADAVEASSRTLGEYSEASVNNLVESIISVQEREDQFSDAPLTFRDLTEVKNAFSKRLVTIHHSRTAYPPRN